MNLTRAPMRIAELAYTRPASQMSPAIAATIKASARPNCQAGTSPPEIRTAMRIGANGGGTDATRARGFVGSAR